MNGGPVDQVVAALGDDASEVEIDRWTSLVANQQLLVEPGSAGDSVAQQVKDCTAQA